MKKHFAVSAILAALLVAPVAHAANSATMTLDWSNFSISFLKGSGSFSTDLTAAYANTTVYNNVTSFWQYSQSMANTSLAGAAASSNVNGTVVNADAFADYSSSSYALAISQAGIAGSATLDKGAIIEFSVPFSASVAVSQINLKGEVATATGGIFVNFTDGAVSRYWQDSLAISADAWTPLSNSSGTFDVIIKNTTNGAQTFSWSAYSQATAQTYLTTPVPEPETYAMLIAGLGIIGACVRRRKQQA